MDWLESLTTMPRVRKRRVLLVADGLLVVICLHLAVVLQENSLYSLSDARLWSIAALLAPASIAVFRWLGVYRLVIRYMNHYAVPVLCSAVLCSALMAASLLVVQAGMLAGDFPPVSTLVIYALMLLISVGGLRFSLRELYLRNQGRQRKPVVVYGAGAAGCELVSALLHGRDYEPVAFVDDWRGLEGAMVEGLRVYQPLSLTRLIDDYKIEMVLLAIPSAPRCRRYEILQQLSALSVPIQTVPGSADVIAGRASISEIRDVALEDLLGREPVPPFPELMDANIRGKSVMVTGAGGSIGSEMCRQIITQQPARLLLIENCEYALYAIERELVRHPDAGKAGAEIIPLLVSVQRRDVLETIFQTFEVHTVYHTAAYKHVPMVENNLIEGIRNNVFGTLTLVRAAAAANIETFVMVSTDKAVRPTNAMGASKRLTELICQAYATRASEGGYTRFCMVRFGNVLGSSGSVVPVFQNQIEQGGPVVVTDPEITRYFMTIREAAQLVLQAGAMGRAGEVFVLDMGKPVRIAELAANMIRLSGLEVKDEEHPDGDIEIVYSGLRPGEKLYEELLIGGEVHPTQHPRIMTCQEVYLPWHELEALLGELKKAMNESNYSRILQLLKDAPLGYAPDGKLVDLIWRARLDKVVVEPDHQTVLPRSI